MRQSSGTPFQFTATLPVVVISGVASVTRAGPRQPVNSLAPLPVGLRYRSIKSPASSFMNLSDLRVLCLIAVSVRIFAVSAVIS